MHRRLEAELLPLDTELERTLRNMKKVRVAEAVVIAEQQETNQNECNTPNYTIVVYYSLGYNIS